MLNTKAPSVDEILTEPSSFTKPCFGDVIQKIAEHYKIKLSQRTEGAIYHSFDLSIPLIQGTMTGISCLESNIAHEIAHFLVASAEERLLPNFGLGAVRGFSAETDRSSCSIPRQRASKIENLAILLHACIVRDFGGCFQDTLSEFGYYERTLEGDELKEAIQSEISELISLGLLVI